MAVMEVDRQKPDLQGDSGDTMPTTGVADGILFHEIDTGKVYVFHAGGWELDKRLETALASIFGL